MRRFRRARPSCSSSRPWLSSSTAPALGCCTTRSAIPTSTRTTRTTPTTTTTTTTTTGHDGHGKGHTLNLRGAWLHLIGDTLGALAALIAALVIRFGGPAAADPIASFVVAGILLFGSLRLLRDATLVLLEAAPRHLPVATIREIVAGFPGVTAVHDLHVWTLGAGHDAVTVHVKTQSTDPTLGQRLGEKIRSILKVEYVTVQVEAPGEPCGAPPSTWENSPRH